MDDRRNLIKKEETGIEKTRKINTAIPNVDIFENDEEILLHADMPGVVKDDISVNIDNGTLSLSGVRKTECPGERMYEEFSDIEYVRKFSVPQTIEIDKVVAEIKTGVLKLHLPKSEAAKPTRIQVQAAQ